MVAVLSLNCPTVYSHSHSRAPRAAVDGRNETKHFGLQVFKPWIDISDVFCATTHREVPSRTTLKCCSSSYFFLLT